MKTFLPFFALLVVFQTSSADNIFLRNGLVYRNVHADTTGPVVVVDLITEIDTVDKSSILLVELCPLTNEKPYMTSMTEAQKKFFENNLSHSFMQAADTVAVNTDNFKQRTTTVDAYSQDHKALIPAFFLFLLAAAEFDRAAGYTSAMEDGSVNRFFHTDGGLPNYSKLRTQAYIIGAAAAVLGAAVTIHALTPIKIFASPNHVTIGYTF